MRSILLVSILLPSLCFAMFCPSNNFSIINEGDSIEDVTKQCGTPDKIETSEIKNEYPQEWSYFLPQTVGIMAQGLNEAQGTLKTQITFDSEGKLINISVNGIGVGSTSICGNAITLGDTAQTVRNTCGEPTFINSSTNPATAQKVIKKTTFIYMSNPPTQIEFLDGKLVAPQ